MKKNKKEANIVGGKPGMEIITTKEKIDEVVKFGIITAFRYCILNKLDFSIGSEDDDNSVAHGLHDEMFVDENNVKLFNNKYTSTFNKTGL